MHSNTSHYECPTETNTINNVIILSKCACKEGLRSALVFIDKSN